MRDQLRQEGDRHEDEEGRGGVLGELSLSAIVASALAAATSFALSSRIGLAGSIIGVAVAAGASALAAQVYKGMIKASAQKLKDLSYDHADDPDPTRPGVPLSGHDGNTGLMPAAVESPLQEGRDVSFAATGTPIAPDSLRSAATRQQSRRVAHRAAIALAAFAVLAVLAYAAIVSLVTAGQGIGPSLGEVAQPTVTEETAAQGKGESDAASSAVTSQEDASSADSSASGTSSSSDTKGDKAKADASSSGTESSKSESGSSSSGSGSTSGTSDSGSTSGSTSGSGGSSTDASSSSGSGSTDSGSTSSSGSGGTTSSDAGSSASSSGSSSK